MGDLNRCRVAMLRMQADGLIQLPPPTCQRPQVRIQFTPATTGLSVTAEQLDVDLRKLSGEE